MSVLAPFQITQDEIDRTSLDQSDLGRWAVLIAGCYHLFSSKARAHHAYRSLIGEGAAHG